MHGLEVEHRHIAEGKSLSQDLARHLSGRYGDAIVVADKPIYMMVAVRKQWLKIEHQYQVERARSLDREKISKICNQIAYMQGIKFSAKPPENMLSADVTFATADDFVAASSMCQTAYVTYEFASIKLHLLTSWMPNDGLIVIYD